MTISLSSLITEMPKLTRTGNLNEVRKFSAWTGMYKPRSSWGTDCAANYQPGIVSPRWCWKKRSTDSIVGVREEQKLQTCFPCLADTSPSTLGLSGKMTGGGDRNNAASLTNDMWPVSWTCLGCSRKIFFRKRKCEVWNVSAMVVLMLSASL